MRILLFPILAFAFLLGVVQIGNACTCAPKPTVLDEFDSADEVGILRVVSVDKAGDTDDDRYVNGVRRTTMVVERMFKGKLTVRDEIVFGQGNGSDCIWTFSEESIGHQYLMYLNRTEKRDASDYVPSKEPGLWFAFGCGRSTGVDHASEDLLYLENMQKLRGKTRISGTIGGWMNPDLAVEGKRIKIIGAKKTYETKTDKDGVFEIYDLPPGRYFIEPETPAGWRVAADWLRYSPSVVGNEYGRPESKTLRQVAITLEAKKHAGVYIIFEPDNRVSGRVIGPKGKPLRDICVYLLRAGATMGASDCTDAQGRFEIASVDPGEYVLGANANDKPSGGQPFRKIFYPGVSERDRAAVISVRPGENVENLDFVISRLEETVTIKGVLRYSDGNPAAEERVKFKVTEDADKVDGDVSGQTDSAGRFTLTVLKGLTGELAGEDWLFEGVYKNCPKADELIAKSGGRFVTVYSNAIKLTTEQNLYDVELKLPIPRCERVKQ